MAVAERTAYRRQLQRALRDYDVRRGVRTPGTIREVEIWRQAMRSGKSG